MPIDMNMLKFFQRKCARTAAKTKVMVRKKKPGGTSFAIFGVGTAAKCSNSSVEPTEFAAEPTTKVKSSKANLLTRTFRLPPKRQLSILLNFPFHL